MFKSVWNWIVDKIWGAALSKIPFLGIIEFIFNNILWILAGIALVVGAFLWHGNTVKSDKQQALITAQQVQLNQAKAQHDADIAAAEAAQINLNNLANNQKALNNVIDKFDQLKQGQANIQEEINNVPISPVTQNDHPFLADPGLMSRADILRNEQQASPPTTPTRPQPSH